MKKLSLLIWLFFLSPMVWAAAAEKPKETEKTKELAAPTSSNQSQDAFNKSHDAMALSQRLEAMDSVEGRFEQLLFDNKGELLETTKGDFALKRPGFFYWKSDEPFPQTVVGNPSTLWVYDPDLEQVTVRTQDTDAVHNPARLLSNDISDLEKIFTVTATKNGVFKLEPLDEEAPFASVSFKFVKDKIDAISFTDQLGQKTELSLSISQINKTIDMQLFNFIPPEGTDVLLDE